MEFAAFASSSHSAYISSHVIVTRWRWFCAVFTYSKEKALWVEDGGMEANAKKLTHRASIGLHPIPGSQPAILNRRSPPSIACIRWITSRCAGALYLADWSIRL